MWLEVTKRERVWSSTHTVHKMGWAAIGTKVNVVEEYQAWSRFDSFTGGADIKPFGDGYNEWWIPSNVLAPSSASPPGLSDVSDAQLGAALRTIANFFRG